MTTPSAQDASLTEHILATQQHRSRMKDDDPAYTRLRDATQRRLSASLQRLVRELRGAHPTEQHAALSDFISRQTAILQDAYIAAHNAGASDYFGEVSQTPETWAKRSTVDPDKMRRVLSFYAPSIAKMAHEALAAVNAAPGVKMEEVIEESVQLGFFSGFSRVTSGMRGALGGVGNDPNHTLYGPHHHFAGRAAGEHEANIHEHLAVQHHGDDAHGGGAGRRLSRPPSHSPNENARSSRSHASERSDASIRREQLANGARLSETRFGQRPESRVDESGQQMPFSHGEFRFALNNIRLMGRSENAAERTAGVNDSGFIKINGREYFAKAISDPYYHPHTEGTNEVVANGIAKMMGLGEHVPAESYHLYFQHPGAAEGHHWSVMSLEKGAKTFEQMENGDGRYHTKLERALRHPDAIKELLFEYIVSNSHGDRHAGNVMFQPSSGRIIHIDFGRAFPRSAEFKPYDNGYISRFFATQFKIHQAAIDHPTDRGIAAHIKIPHADLAHIRSIGQRILDMAAIRGMGLEHSEFLDGLQTRLTVLEELSFGGDKTVANLMDTAEAYS